MNNTKQYLDQQEAIQLQNRIVSFMRDFKIGTLLHKNGIRKLRGVSPLTFLYWPALGGKSGATVAMACTPGFSSTDTVIILGIWSTVAS